MSSIPAIAGVLDISSRRRGGLTGGKSFDDDFLSICTYFFICLVQAELSCFQLVKVIGPCLHHRPALLQEARSIVCGAKRIRHSVG